MCCFFTRRAYILFHIMPFSSKPHDLAGTYFSKFPFFSSSSAAAAASFCFFFKQMVCSFFHYFSVVGKEEEEEKIEKMCAATLFHARTFSDRQTDRDSASVLDHIRGRHSPKMLDIIRTFSFFCFRFPYFYLFRLTVFNTSCGCYYCLPSPPPLLLLLSFVFHFPVFITLRKSFI